MLTAIQSAEAVLHSRLFEVAIAVCLELLLTNLSGPFAAKLPVIRRAIAGAAGAACLPRTSDYSAHDGVATIMQNTGVRFFQEISVSFEPGTLDPTNLVNAKVMKLPGFSEINMAPLPKNAISPWLGMQTAADDAIDAAEFFFSKQDGMSRFVLATARIAYQ